MKITILSVGKKPHGAEADVINQYMKRIQKPLHVEWKFISHQPGDAEAAKKAESRAILDLLSEDDYILLLDERGRSIDNQTLARLLDPQAHTYNVSIIIGGAYGVDEDVRKKADVVISLSSLVFPHKLVRMIVAEQMYRTQSILQGHPYHHS